MEEHSIGYATLLLKYTNIIDVLRLDGDTFPQVVPGTGLVSSGANVLMSSCSYFVANDAAGT